MSIPRIETGKLWPNSRLWIARLRANKTSEEARYQVILSVRIIPDPVHVVSSVAILPKY